MRGEKEKKKDPTGVQGSVRSSGEGVCAQRLRLHFSPTSQSKPRQTEQEIVSLSRRRGREM